MAVFAFFHFIFCFRLRLSASRVGFACQAFPFKFCCWLLVPVFPVGFPCRLPLLAPPFGSPCPFLLLVPSVSSSCRFPLSAPCIRSSCQFLLSVPSVGSFCRLLLSAPPVASPVGSSSRLSLDTDASQRKYRRPEPSRNKIGKASSRCFKVVSVVVCRLRDKGRFPFFLSFFSSSSSYSSSNTCDFDTLI